MLSKFSMFFFLSSFLAVKDNSIAKIFSCVICSINDPVPDPNSTIFDFKLFVFIQLFITFPKYLDTSGEVKKSPLFFDLTFFVLKKPNSE